MVLPRFPLATGSGGRNLPGTTPLEVACARACSQPAACGGGAASGR